MSPRYVGITTLGFEAAEVVAGRGIAFEELGDRAILAKVTNDLEGAEFFLGLAHHEARGRADDVFAGSIDHESGPQLQASLLARIEIDLIAADLRDPAGPGLPIHLGNDIADKLNDGGPEGFPLHGLIEPSARA